MVARCDRRAKPWASVDADVKEETMSEIPPFPFDEEPIPLPSTAPEHAESSHAARTQDRPRVPDSAAGPHRRGKTRHRGVA